MGRNSMSKSLLVNLNQKTENRILERRNREDTKNSEKMKDQKARKVLVTAGNKEIELSSKRR
jgi:hypothetical protein